jgi:uncharacterized protein (DUF1684 family)
MHNQEETPPTWLDLYDYRLRVGQMYTERELALRAGEGEQDVLLRFRAQKDDLFAHHPQSALSVEARRLFTGLKYFPYEPTLRVEALMEPVAETEMPGERSGPNTGGHAPATGLRPAALVRFALNNLPLELVVYWIDVYGGGLFLPFRDATCPEESYGGGRYLFDTVKGSNFTTIDNHKDVGWGYEGGRIILDFNYAYNPSCAYDDRWVCPLAPKENRLPVPIPAGERKFHQ